MALKIVLLAFVALPWTDGSIQVVNSSVNTAELEDILTNSQKRLNVSPCDSLSLVNQALAHEIGDRVKQQTAIENIIKEQQNHLMQLDAGMINETLLESKITELQSQVKQELDARVIIQRHLARRITQLETKLTNGAVGPTIAFSAENDYAEGNLVNEQTVNFTLVHTNVGGGYNGTTSTFRCPVKGVYQFIVSIRFEPDAAIRTALVRTGKRGLAVFSGSAAHPETVTRSVLWDLQAGDEVYVVVSVIEPSAAFIWGFSTFDGHLVHTL